MKKSVSFIMSVHLIDEHCKSGGQLLKDAAGKEYSCILNQTDIKSNKNKFYIMQLIKTTNNYIHFIRYGRIGEPGKASEDSYGNESAAVSAFTKQFKMKTGNSWSTPFVKQDGKYFLSEVSYENELKDVPASTTTVPESKLDKQVQDLIRMVSDVDMMKQALVTLNIDTKKMPLGKLKDTQINAAKEVIDEIDKKLKELVELNKDRTTNAGSIETIENEITDLSSRYYTLIPYSCGRKKPPVINDNDMIKNLQALLDDLMTIVVGVQIVQQKVDAGCNPIDSVYKDIKTVIKPIGKTERIYSEVEKYIKNTHGSTHGCKLEMLNLYDIEQEGKKGKFDSCGVKHNRMLLWHGTPQSCILSIFKHDFYLDPTKLNSSIQIAGKMFGYGVYWADMVTKSFNYTRAADTKHIACMILGEIALGDMYQTKNADYNLNKAELTKKKKHSTKGVGKWAPSSTTVLDDGLIIPNGEAKLVDNSASLRYNEYIVYDINQINIKYLVIIKNNGDYSGY